MGRVKLEGYRCERCNHIWVPRDEEIPRVCPKCKSPYWDIPRGIRRDSRRLNIQRVPSKEEQAKSLVK